MNTIVFNTCDQLDATGLVTTVFTQGQLAWGCMREGDCVDEESLANYESLAAQLDITTSDMVRGHQAHTAIVKRVTRAHGGTGVVSPTPFDACDGFVTNERGLMLTTGEADCLPIYMLDPVNRAIGMVHSGWRGTAQLIGPHALAFMEAEFGTRAADVLIYFGPSICGSCYEVGSELLDEFGREFADAEMQTFFTPFVKQDAAGAQKYLLDNAAAARLSLERVGVAHKHIFDCGICTYESPDFASYRQTHEHRPHLLSGIMLK